MLLEAVNINEVRNVQQDHGKTGLLGPHILHEGDLGTGERVGQDAAEHVDEDRLPKIQGHTAKPWPHRQPPQVGAREPMQSVSFSSSRSQPPQKRHGAYLNSCTR